MKWKTFFLFSLGALQAHCFEPPVGQSIYEKWESPTPDVHDRYTDFLAMMPQDAVAVEVGVQGGGFASYMICMANPKQLFLIDCWQQQDPEVYNDPEANVSDDMQEQLYQHVIRRFDHDPRVSVIREFSCDAVNRFEDESLDWVYLDANHGYDAIKHDLEIWWPKIKKGGILSGHDYAVHPSFGVVQAVNEFLLEKNLYFYCLTREKDHIYDSWAVQKPID